MAEVGRLLADVQREISSLREAISLPSIAAIGTTSTKGSSGPGSLSNSASVSKLQDLLTKAEASLQARADELLTTIMRADVASLPMIQPARSVGSLAPMQRRDQAMSSLGPADLDLSTSLPRAPAQEMFLSGSSPLHSRAGMAATSSMPARRSHADPRSELEHPSLGLTLARIDNEPTSAPIRQVGSTIPHGKRAKAKQAKPVGVIPARQRLDPFADPTPITEGDVRCVCVCVCVCVCNRSRWLCALLRAMLVCNAV
jgi:hypothetical protein